MAERVRSSRHQVSPQNPFLKAQEAASEQIINALRSWGKIRDCLVENFFLATYGSPVVQAVAGIDPKSSQPQRKAPKSALHRELVQNRNLKSGVTKGGVQECALRGLIYVALASGRLDERSVNALRRIRLSGELPPMTLDEFKDMACDQFFMLLLDTEATLEAIPALLTPVDPALRQNAFTLIANVMEASGELTGDHDGVGGGNPDAGALHFQRGAETCPGAEFRARHLERRFLPPVVQARTVALEHPIPLQFPAELRPAFHSA